MTTAPKVYKPTKTYTLRLIHPTTKPPTHTNKGMKTEVYAFKSQAHINAISNYLFSKSSEKLSYRCRNYLFFSLGLNLGFRASDLVQLKWKNIYHPSTCAFNLDDWNVVIEQKTGKTRQVVLNHPAQRAVTAYIQAMGLIPEALNPDEYVFASRKKNHGHVNPDTMRVIIKDAAAAVGVPFNVGTHSMRKTFGYNMYKATNDLAVVQRLLNHESQDVTVKYIGIDQERVRAAYDTMDDVVWTP